VNSSRLLLLGVLTAAGKNYFIFSAWEGETQKIYIIEMNDPTSLVGARTRLSWPEFAWEQEGSDHVNEGLGQEPCACLSSSERGIRRGAQRFLLLT
jgi:GH43 family beta-xylosidase